MDVTADELAGVVDLFGGLTREELERALSEAAYRADGGTVDEAALAETIDDALESFALVAYDPAGAGPAEADATADEADGGDDRDGATDGGDETLLVAGPTAFPTVPEAAEDVPYILDVDPRRLDREALGETAREHFAAAVTAAIDDGDVSRCRRLLDASYDVESWAPVDCGAERDRLTEALE